MPRGRRGFDENEHPRWPRGAPDDASGDGQGGRFREAGDLAGSIVGNLHGVTTGPWVERASDQIGARRGEHPRMRYNARVVDAAQQQWDYNRQDNQPDEELSRLIGEFNVAQAQNDVARQDAAADALRARLETGYGIDYLPAAPDRRDAPRSADQDQRNRALLQRARQTQAQIEANNDGDPDEGLQIRIDRLSAEQGRTGRRVEADRAAEDLRQYMADDPEGLIAAHGRVAPAPRQASPLSGYNASVVQMADNLQEQRRLAGQGLDRQLDQPVRDFYAANTAADQDAAVDRIRERLLSIHGIATPDRPSEPTDLLSTGAAEQGTVDEMMSAQHQHDSLSQIAMWSQERDQWEYVDNLRHEPGGQIGFQLFNPDGQPIASRTLPSSAPATWRVIERGHNLEIPPGRPDSAEYNRLSALDDRDLRDLAVEHGMDVPDLWTIRPVDRASMINQILHVQALERSQPGITVGGRQVTADHPETASLGTVAQMVNGGVAVDIRQSDGTWHEVRSVTADSPHLGNLVIHYRGTGFVDHRPADEQIPYRVVDFSAPAAGPAELFPASHQVRPDTRIEISDVTDEDTGETRWRRITRAEYTSDGNVALWFADGGHFEVPRDMQMTYRVERRPAQSSQPRIDPRSEADRALVFQREDNDRYNQRVFDRAVEIDQEHYADVADSEDEGIRRLREKMQTYRDAMENPDDPESVDAAIDDLVDELSDWDIFFNSQGFTVSSHEQATEPQRPDYTNPLPIGYRGPTLTSSYQPPPMPRRTTVADLQPGQTLSDGLGANTGHAFEDQVPQGYRDAIHEIYDYYDRHTGMRSEVTDMSISGDEAEIVGKIYNQDGSKIGSFRRKIGPGTNIHHSRFEIDDRGAQGGGFTSRWFEQVKQQYREQGFRTVTVSANIDVGGYAWAKIGFDFQSRTDAGALLSKAESTGTVKLAVGELSDETMAEWEALQRRWDAGEWITPLEISRIGWAQRGVDIFDGYPRETDNGDQIEMWLGKYIMLGSSWAGKLTL